jgi:hypothetical protein
VADWLVSQQDDDGYLGNYAADRRFTVPQPPRPESWNGEPALRTWDIWTHSYLVLGFRKPGAGRGALPAGRVPHCRPVLAGAGSGIDITTLGNHHGMSATVLLDPAADLYLVTGEPRYLALAEKILQQANANPRLALLDKAHWPARTRPSSPPARPTSCAGTWSGWPSCTRPPARMSTASPSMRCGTTSAPTTSPWAAARGAGGAPFARSVQRAAHVLPQAYVETCSVLAWMQLNRELLAITGHARHADELERTAYNDLLAAMAPDGEDWCYYTFPNGKRVHTTYWRCCKSSGAMAVEELPQVAYGTTADGGLRVNLYGAGERPCTTPRPAR